LEKRVMNTELAFQYGSTPVGRGELNNLTTLHISTTAKAMERNIETNMIPKRGLKVTSSRMANLYWRFIS
jgi:hypothetical protein